jgi:peptidoglycan/LPS O-acetylase OafA/YrhL
MAVGPRRSEDLGHIELRSANMHFGLVEGLRAVAACAVFAFHLYVALTLPGERHGTVHQLAGMMGAAGVAVFFVISGFLLYRPFSAAIQGVQTQPSVRRFLIRRAARILPAFWLAFAVLAAANALTQVTWHDAPIYLALLQDYSNITRYHGIPPGWSLSIEATYYVLLPLGAMALLRLARGRQRVEILAIVAMALLVPVIYAVRPSAPETILRHLDWFAWGMLLASLSVSSRRGAQRHGARRWVTGALLGAVVVTSYVVAAKTPMPMVQEAALGIFGASLVWGTTNPHRVGGTMERLLGHPVLAWLGLISYGIYLWHSPLVSRLHADGVHSVGLVLASAGITLVAATASFYALERPIQRWSKRVA